MRVALVDADILAYQAAASAEKPVDWGDGLWTLHCFEQDAVAAFEASLERIKEKTQASKLVLAFSDKANWRKTVLPTYKSNRVGVRKPMLLSFLKTHAEAKYDCRQIPTLEGDDILGLTMTGSPDQPYIVCSLDKDLKTIPGEHYNFGRDQLFSVSEDQADYWHYFQTLTGDTTDGYPGCPGCGPKTAEKILEPFYFQTGYGSTFDREGAWKAVVKAFKKAGFSEEEALVQARVARIMRSGDYDFENNQVNLWTPN